MYPSAEEVIKWKRKYRTGMRVRLIYMDSVESPPVGTEGTVDHVDSIGTLHVKWDTGDWIGLVLGEDRFEVIG